MTTRSTAKSKSSRAPKAPWARFAATALVAGIGLVACQAPPSGEPDVSAQAEPQQDAREYSEVPEELNEPPVFTIAGVGDVLTHDHILEAAEALADENNAEEAYDFLPLMTEVSGWIAGADLALCGLEVPLAPPGREPVGYPVFAAPEPLVPALAEIGFHGCATANNHSMDAGTAGVERTLEVFDAHGLGHVGTARTEDEAADAQFYTLAHNDTELTVAHLATTELHNIAPPSQSPWMVTSESAEQLNDRAVQAREDGADIVVASVHWGTEYAHEPDEAQRAYGQALAEAGQIDLVLGSHPHTPQPIEQLDGGPHDAGMWVAWSMGNFLTNQDADCCVMETATGAIVYAEVEVAEDQPAQVTDISWTPVTVDRSAAQHRGIWPLAELVEADELPAQIELDAQTVQERWDRVVEVVGEEHLITEAPEAASDELTVKPRQQ